MVQQFRWRKFLLVCGFVWLFQATYTTMSTGLVQQYSGGQVRWLAISIYSYCSAFAWFLLTPLIFYIMRRYLVITMDKGKLIAAHIMLALLMSSTQRLINILFSYNLIKATNAVDLTLLKLSNFFGLSFLQHLGNGILVYFVIVAILYGYLFYKWNKEAQLQKAKLSGQLSKAQLENLKYQLQPHFLFNSLQSVSTLMHRDIGAADQALGDLGDILRYSIRQIDKQKVILGEELLFLQKYIDLQTTRFNDKLDVDIEYNEDLINVLVPAFYLQPIVENSIKHVLEATGQKTNIQISICKSADRLISKCCDNGVTDKSGDKDEASGLGLENLNNRLQAIYNNNFVLTYGNDESGFSTSVDLPLELE